MKNIIDNLIITETKKRLDIIESADYIYPPSHTRADFGIIICSIILCIALIALCMIGVI